MADAENLLSQLLKRIAEELQYDDYKTEMSLINSGGANYTSQLYNITISAPNKENQKLFAKVAALGEKIRSVMTMGIFEKEIFFYDKIFTKYREIEERFKFPKEERLILPKYYGGSTEHMKEMIVLEDVTARGYRAFDRFTCFDWEYASKCISELAKYHALSVRFERDCDEFEELIKKLEFKFSLDQVDFIENAVHGAIEVTDEENKERLAKHIKEHMTQENVLKLWNPTRKVVLNHGDFKPANILQRTNENGKLELVMIDYQLSQKGNPVTDLLHYLICGSDEEFRAKHLNQYFEHYYAEFSKILKRLEIDPDEVYSKEDFDDDVKTMLPLGIFFGVVSLPLATVDVDDAPKLEEGVDFDNFKIKMSDLFRKRFNGLVRDYVKMGVL